MGLPTPYSFTDPLNPTPNPALESDEARVAFWEKQAQRLTWAEPWHTAHRFESRSPSASMRKASNSSRSPKLSGSRAAS